MSSSRSIRWSFAILSTIGIEMIMIASAFLWVAIYAYGLNPGHPEQFYEAYAKTASPVVSVVVGPLVFFVVSRWMVRRLGRPAGLSTALFTAGLYIAVDVAVVAGLSEGSAYIWTMSLLSHTTKLAAAFAGGHARAS